MTRRAPVAIAALTLCGLANPAPAAATESTAYCLTGTMADGTHTRTGSLAHNGYPLGTRLWIRPSPTGRRRWTVRDRIGHGTQLDFWLPSCDTAITWGRRHVTVTVGWNGWEKRKRARDRRRAK
jgi:3D (Asp-Asp-Asp) domain-containing protein